MLALTQNIHLQDDLYNKINKILEFNTRMKNHNNKNIKEEEICNNSRGRGFENRRKR